MIRLHFRASYLEDRSSLSGLKRNKHEAEKCDTRFLFSKEDFENLSYKKRRLKHFIKAAAYPFSRICVCDIFDISKLLSSLIAHRLINKKLKP
jgi:hypothetical protein